MHRRPKCVVEGSVETRRSEFGVVDGATRFIAHLMFPACCVYPGLASRGRRAAC